MLEQDCDQPGSLPGQHCLNQTVVPLRAQELVSSNGLDPRNPLLSLIAAEVLSGCSELYQEN